ncbi:MAG: hypothetical protein IH587_00395 [Anaerolineae bacterium]|nr:hypothetical protein [Anaerolineae bacterium]
MNDGSSEQKVGVSLWRRVVPIQSVIVALLMLALSGCAIREITDVAVTPSAGPAFEIPPPPAQVFVGACSLANRNQEFWIQTAAGQTASFGTLFTRAMTEIETRPNTMDQLRRLRDDTYLNPTPECAVPIQLLLTSAMDRAVESLRLTMLDPRIDISGTAALVEEMLTQVEDQLKLMTDDLERQMQTRAAS